MFIVKHIVELGVQIDQPGFDRMQSTLQRTDSAVASSTSGWVKDFAKAGSVITSVISAVGTATVGLMVNIAKQDLEMEKYARSMLISKDAAAKMKTAVDALGHSIQDIAITPELRNQYAALIKDAGKMTIGGDFEAQAKNMRQVMFEFTRLKQEAAYALQWIAYYLYKNLSGPLGDIRQKFKGLNDSIIKTMPLWTKKIADGLTHIINIGQAAIRLIKNVTGYLGKLWDSFPKGVKIATAALATLFTFISVGPVGKFTMLLSAALLLVEDFFGYIDGKQAAFGPAWEKLIEYAGIAEVVFAELKVKAVELFNEITNSKAFKGFVETLEKTGVKLYNLAESGVKFLQKTLTSLFRQIEQSGAVKEFIELILELAAAFYDLVETIITDVLGAVAELYEYFDDTGSIDNITSAVKSLWNGLVSLGKGFANVFRETKKWFDYIKQQDSFKQWWEGLKQTLKGVVDVAASVVTHLGNIGRAVGLLMQGEFREAAAVFGNSYLDNIKETFSGLGDIFGGGWKMIKGNLKSYGDMVDYLSGTKGEGHGWRRETGSVNIEGMNAESKDKLDILGKLYQAMTGREMVVSSGKRDWGGHVSGDKIDLVDSGDSRFLEDDEDGFRSSFVKLLKEAGAKILDAYTPEEYHGTAKHLDIDLSGLDINKLLSIIDNAVFSKTYAAEVGYYSDSSDKNELKLFMEAIGSKESGSKGKLGKYDAYNPDDAGQPSLGKYQIQQSNWSPWAVEAGLLPNADWRDPKNQDIVAAFKMKQYYDIYRDWKLVAAAWNGGQGAIGKDANGNYYREYSIGYSNDVISRMDDFKSTVPDFSETVNSMRNFKTQFQKEAANADPYLTSSIMSRGASNSATYNNGGNTTINLDVGDIIVNVPPTSTSPQDIGNAVQNGVIKGTSQAQYMLLYRSVGGIA